MSGSARVRRAVLCGAEREWLDAVERAWAPLAVEVVARWHRLGQALAALKEHEPELLITVADDAEDLQALRRAREQVSTLVVVAVVASEAGAAAALAAGASLVLLRA